jgi:PleD family two-component response regulator
MPAWSDAVTGAQAYQAQFNQAQPIRLLLVEDEFLISEMVAEDLSEQGFVVRAVANGPDALSHLASAAVDILFTDVYFARRHGRHDARSSRPGNAAGFAGSLCVGSCERV